MPHSKVKPLHHGFYADDKAAKNKSDQTQESLLIKISPDRRNL